MGKFRKKQIEIEAIRYISANVFDQVLDFVGRENLFVTRIVRAGHVYKKVSFGIRTLEGIMHVSEGDYIIKGIQGEFYPCKPDVFEQSYEEVTESKTAREMFEELGFEVSYESGIKLEYRHKKIRYYYIDFDLRRKVFACLDYKTGNALYVNPKDLLAITKQMQELGWM